MKNYRRILAISLTAAVSLSGTQAVHAQSAAAEEIKCPAAGEQPLSVQPTIKINYKDTGEKPFPVKAGQKVQLSGTGWCAQPGHGGSKIIVKFDGGAVPGKIDDQLPDKFKGRGVYQIIEASDTDGSFEGVELEIPKVEEGIHSVSFLTGSFKENDTPNSITKKLQIGEYVPEEIDNNRFFHPPRTAGKEDTFANILPPSREDAIIAIPNNKEQTIKIIVPHAQPGQWVTVFTLSNAKYLHEEQDCNNLDWSQAGSLRGISIEDQARGKSANNDWFKLDENRSLELSYRELYYNATKRGYGPYALVVAQDIGHHYLTDENGNDIDYDNDPDYDKKVNANVLKAWAGWAWLHDHGTPWEPQITRGFTDPIDPTKMPHNAETWAFGGFRNNPEGIAKLKPNAPLARPLPDDLTDLQKKWWPSWNKVCKLQGIPEKSNNISYPVEPIVNNEREIIIPKNPGVEYFIDGKRVTDAVPAETADAESVKVIAKPAEGFRFLLADEKGFINPDNPQEQEFVVEIPAAPKAPEPDPTEQPKPDPTEQPKPDPTEQPKPDPTEQPKPDPTEQPQPDPTEQPQPNPSHNGSSQGGGILGGIAGGFFGVLIGAVFTLLGIGGILATTPALAQGKPAPGTHKPAAPQPHFIQGLLKPVFEFLKR